jgi:hypothetical protein
MQKISLALITILFLIVILSMQTDVGIALSDDNHLPLQVSIPEGKAYNVTNQEIYNKTVTVFFLVDHDWVYANQLQNDLITVDYYRYNLDNQGWVTFTPYSQDIQEHGYPNGGRSVTEINSLKLYDLSEGKHSIEIFAKMVPIIARYSSLFGGTVDIGSTTATSNMKYFTVDTTAPSISMQSIENKTYTTKQIPLTFTVNEPTTWTGYSLDGQDTITVIQDLLINFQEGHHSITVYAKDEAGISGNSETVYFTIVPSSSLISVSSPSNTTYTTDTISLQYTVNESLSAVTYSLDNKTKASTTEKTVLSNLSEGSHNITLFAQDTQGNTVTSNTIFFTVKTENPLTTVLILIILVTIIGVSTLIIYFKKTKHLSH